VAGGLGSVFLDCASVSGDTSLSHPRGVLLRGLWSPRGGDLQPSS
jgi:hypothetical protein